MTAVSTWRAWSCSVRVCVADDASLEPARRTVTELMDEVDRAASRFRPDSALVACNERAGRVSVAPPLLVTLVQAALRAAEQTDGLVDPTVGRQLEAAGYDGDIESVRLRPAGRRLAVVADPAPPSGWRAVRVDPELGLVGVPAGRALDLGAIAKAWTADRAARRVHARTGGPVLVELGGDLAVAGAESDPFIVRVAEHEGGPGDVLAISTGGLATSTTTVRRWLTERGAEHHIIDPRTGRPAGGPWRTASVWAPDAVTANTWSTAAIVLGDAAASWLDDRQAAARLIDQRGRVSLVGAWPLPEVVA